MFTNKIDKNPDNTPRRNSHSDYPLTTPAYRLISYVLDSFLTGITLFIGWIIWSFFTWKESTTPGHKLIGQKILVYKTGEPASWLRMFIREMVVKLLLSFLAFYTFGLSLLIDGLLVFKNDRRTIHDILAGTIVVDDQNLAILRR